MITPTHNTPDHRDPEEEIFEDKQGRYRWVWSTRKIPRRSYFYGLMRGKYWGTSAMQQQDDADPLYHFTVYEANVYLSSIPDCTCITQLKPECNGLHTEAEGKFEFAPNSGFSRRQLPARLPVILTSQKQEYVIDIHDPQMADVTFISNLHQTEGEEVFGTIEATITGFILDYIEEKFREKIYFKRLHQPTNAQPSTQEKTPVKKRVQPPVNALDVLDGDIRPTRLIGSRHRLAIRDGCVPSTLGILSIVVWLAFIVAILPKAALVMPFLIFPLILRLIPATAWTWLMRIIGVVLVAGCLLAIWGQPANQSVRKSQNDARRSQASDIDTWLTDSVITHHVRWNNYEGEPYEGNISIKQAALREASAFKNSINIAGNAQQRYNDIIFRIKEHDKNDLGGVYALFDSIQAARQLPAERFAELIVSFIQSIPYVVVLPDACNASLYSDPFIRKYLADQQAECDGFEKFGINSPVEFMARLKGDCDTRTLLLYTMLSHYRYDVALLSSDHYNHSLLGINLPYEGAAFPTPGKHYVLWETTAAGHKPGLLPSEIANLNYWNISLKNE